MESGYSEQRKLDELGGWDNVDVCLFQIVGFRPYSYVIARPGKGNPPPLSLYGIEESVGKSSTV